MTNLFQIPLLLTLCIIASAVINQADGKIKCVGGKPNYMGLITNPKLGKCVPHISNPGKACNCILEQIGGKPVNHQKAVTFVKSVLPKNCQGQADECGTLLRGYKADPEGKACIPIGECAQKMCEKCCSK